MPLLAVLLVKVKGEKVDPESLAVVREEALRQGYTEEECAQALRLEVFGRSTDLGAAIIEETVLFRENGDPLVRKSNPTPTPGA